MPDGLVIAVPLPKLNVPPEPPVMSIPASPPLSVVVPLVDDSVPMVPLSAPVVKVEIGARSLKDHAGERERAEAGADDLGAGGVADREAPHGVGVGEGDGVGAGNGGRERGVGAGGVH